MATTETPSPTQGSPVHATQQRRLLQFLVWVTRVAVAVAVIEFAAAAWTSNPNLAAGGGVALLVGGALEVARRQAAGGRLDRAVYIVAAGILAGGLAYVAALPGSSLAPTLIPLLLVALAVPYLQGVAMKRLAFAAWVGGTLLVTLNALLPPVEGVPGIAGVAFRLLAFSAVSGLAILLLVHSSQRLQESLEATRQSHERLAEAHGHLQDLDRLKTQFLNTAAHELRTPMTPVLLEVELLSSERLGPLTERQRKALRILGRNIDRLNTLVEDVLDIARLQADQMPLHAQPVEVNLLVAEAAESFHEVASKGGVVLELRATSGLRVEADPRRITQVLFNLLGNAVKFTPRGGRVVVEARPALGGCQVHVRDTGVGIRAEDLPRLFEPFSQLHDTMQVTRAGAGLGLYISKGIIERHGGRIWAESAGPGQGATFAFFLPAHPPTPRPVAPVKASGAQAAPPAPAPAPA